MVDDADGDADDADADDGDADDEEEAFDPRAGVAVQSRARAHARRRIDVGGARVMLCRGGPRTVRASVALRRRRKKSFGIES